MRRSNATHCRLLRARRERPRRRHAAEQRDELAAPHLIASSARNTIDSGTVGAGALAFLAFSAVFVSIGKFPSPGSEPERVFTSSQPAIADEILGVERRCFTASLLGTRTRSGRERRAQAGIDVVIAEGLL
jgi:hypothetical protein